MVFGHIYPGWREWVEGGSQRNDEDVATVVNCVEEMLYSVYQLVFVVVQSTLMIMLQCVMPSFGDSVMALYHVFKRPLFM